ncbi:iron-containing alcohol dehydrogenase [Lacrimispora sp. 210928-DFI.3.58]|uniref:iron-containing alcohol dehydrogenase n=1 Tax=Lacrimispora sp. 210928-DFI.3.58 TaxID=2883214 RepID=UPI0015B3C495|nr:iron-containing alcohol dehydrogenase [Lacrimispora sp. 210928-DFI.3.58]MCB7317248.1 iron-containing alcohol dehydrogenase [Lacrimispora sp. 210928-DFI.3.58]
MNKLKKSYCRIYQTAFKAALPFLPYRKPEIAGSVTRIPEIIKKHGCSHVLIITDAGIRGLGLTARLEEALALAGVSYSMYDKTVANPTTANVAEALELYRQEGCDAIVAFGGGSSIDCAKAVGARIVKPKQPLSHMKGILKVHKRIPLLIAVPTTAGTGSETTLAAVITDSETRHKYAINDFPLIPRYAVLDPKVTLSLPPFITATTGMDALTHAVEAYIGNSTTKETRRDALRAVRLIFENLDTAYQDGGNVKARANMLKASFYAGCAFTKSYVGYVHAVAHSLGGEYNVPHGLANAILLPFVLEAYLEASGTGCDSDCKTGSRAASKKAARRNAPGSYCKKLRQLAIAAHAAKKDTPCDEAARSFIQAVKDMKKRFQIGDTVKEIRKEDIPKLARYADKEANPLYPVPVLMDAEELEQFYYLLMEKADGADSFRPSDGNL